MEHRDIGTKLGLAFGILIAILIAVGFLGLSRMDQISANLDDVLGKRWTKLQLAREALAYSSRNSRITMEMFLLNDKQPLDSLLAERANNTQKISELVAKIDAQCDSEYEKQLLAATKESRTPYVASYLKALHLLIDKGKHEAARDIMVRETTPALFAYHEAWNNFAQFQMEQMDKEANQSRARYKRTRAIALSLILLAVTVAAGLAVFVTFRMVSEIKTRMQAENKYRAIFENAIVGIFQATPEGRILSANPAMARMYGYDSPEQMMTEVSDVGRQLFVNPGQRQEVALLLEENNFAENVEVEVYRKDRSRRWLLANVRAARGKDGRVLLHEGTVQDITDRKAAERQAQFLAYYDALTGLPNQTLLQDRLAKGLASARRRKEKVALLFLDLDRFKTINESLGHSVGDLLLKQAAERLQKWSREQDTVARVGDDEFVVVLTAVKDIADAAVAADRVVHTMTSEFLVQDRSLNVTASVGISVYPDHGTDGETLVKNAGAAMSCAKEKGGNNFQFFTQDMNARVVERLTLESSLRVALERGEFFLVYQPQVDVATGQITGAEALLRWQHPELGLVPPDKFIPIAENSGLILPIGEWVLKTACAQARQWQDEGLPAMPVAVNVSAVQFRQETFVQVIRKLLDETGLPPHYLELELTERILISNTDVTLSVLRELKEMGLKLSIDDFGTGYSSLSYLRQFPVYKLKIDRSFVRDIIVNPDDAAITGTIIQMAKNLNLQVIAEGVENEEQMLFLRAHNCDEIQGYYFSKPLIAGEFEKKVRSTSFLKMSEASESIVQRG